jgi:hypothetical protein
MKETPQLPSPAINTDKKDESTAPKPEAKE